MLERPAKKRRKQDNKINEHTEISEDGLILLNLVWYNYYESVSNIRQIDEKENKDLWSNKTNQEL